MIYRIEIYRLEGAFTKSLESYFNLNIENEFRKTEFYKLQNLLKIICENNFYYELETYCPECGKYKLFIINEIIIMYQCDCILERESNGDRDDV